jgi:hypothetical protein
MIIGDEILARPANLFGSQHTCSSSIVVVNGLLSLSFLCNAPSWPVHQEKCTTYVSSSASVNKQRYGLLQDPLALSDHHITTSII